MSSDTKVLIAVLGALGVLSCGCLCLVFGVAFSLPMIHRVREVAVKAEARRAADARARQAASRPRFGPNGPRPPAIRLGPPGEASPFGEPAEDTPPADFTPPEFRLPPTLLSPSEGTPLPASAKRKSVTADGGLGALTESQRKSIYRSATFHERMQETLNKQMRTLRERGLDTSHVERLAAERSERQAQNLDQLCERHHLSRPELDQIIAEGKRQNW